MRNNLFKCIDQVVKGVIQGRDFSLIAYDERQLVIAREKLRLDPYTCLHIDVTGNLVRMLNDKEVFNTACVFRG